MKKIRFNVVKKLTSLICFIGMITQVHGQHFGTSMTHEMQHGFILSEDDQFASHLVASGHHSRQTEVIGQLIIYDQEESQFYQERKLQSAGSSYFLFQAQNLDLPALRPGQVLSGHIIESKIGDYQPKNKIVRVANFYVNKIFLNIQNPFFSGELDKKSFNLSNNHLRQSGIKNATEKKHCCDIPGKVCNWKC